MKSTHPHLIALALYTACALFITHPLITQLDTHFIANEWGQVDGFLSIWNLWWTGQALRTGQSPFFTPLLFYPQGLDLFWLWLSLPNGLLAAPITLTLGPLVAYNLTIIASYILGGYTAFLLVRRFVRDDAAAIAGGALYTLTSFHLRRMLDGVMDTATIQWVPLYLLALHSLLDRPRWWKVLLCGALVLVVGLGSWYYGLFSLMYTGLAALLWAITRPGQPALPGPTPPRVAERLAPIARRLLWGVAPIAVWMVLIAPQLLGMIQNGDRQFGIGLHANESNSADVIDFFVPSRFHPLWGAAITRWYMELRPDAWPRQISLGLVSMVVAAIGARLRLRECTPWLILLGATTLIAMGERLQIFGYTTDIPMPYALIAELPGIRTSHRPSHMLLLSMLLLAMIGGYGVAALIERWPRWRWGIAGSVIAAALLIDGWGGALPLYQLPIPQGYAQALPPHTGGALLVVPINLNVARSEQLWYQTAHGWPIIGGYTGREPPYPIGKYAPGVRELRYGRVEPADIVAPGGAEAARSMLAALDIRYVVFHPDLMKSSIAGQRAVVAELGLSASYQDDRLEVYPVPGAEPRVVGYLGDGWGGLEQQGDRRWRWLGDEPGALYLYNPHPEPRAVTIDLQLESFLRDRALSVQLDQQQPFALDAPRAESRRTIRLLIEPGEHVVYFSAPADRPEDGAGPPRSVSFLHIGVGE